MRLKSHVGEPLEETVTGPLKRTLRESGQRTQERSGRVCFSTPRAWQGRCAEAQPTRFGATLGRRGYTLIEMLATVAGLVIVLGLMSSLARYVRHRSAETLSRDLLVQLDRTLAQYSSLQTALAKVPQLIGKPADVGDDAALAANAEKNNLEFVRVLRRETGGSALRELPLSLYDEVSLRDAWGMPVVYMAPGAPNIGIAPQNRAFLLSAGPDRRFTTLLDNLYSYDWAWEP